MKITEKGKELQRHIQDLRNTGKKIGLVPTMGALHQGHLSLFKNAKRDNDIVIGTVFVNRIQFNKKEDFEVYPRDLEKDKAILEDAVCDILFTPSEEEMYAGMKDLTFEFGHLGEIMEAAHRPGHFEGVAKIVHRFFDLIKPDTAYFGQKDLQQFKVIEKMTKDMKMPVDLILCPTIREDDGLAMSSRNQLLSKENRPVAAKIYGSLNYAGDLLQFGDSVEQVKKKVAEFISKFKPLELEYFEIADSETLIPAKTVQNNKEYVLCIAVFLDGVRLIDNITIIS